MRLIPLPSVRPVEETVPFDAGNLEREIADIMNGPEKYAPRAAITEPPLPVYVAHNEETDEVGRLSAEAIVRQYEEAAKAFEGMATELKSLSSDLDREHARIAEALKYVEETATAYREEGKRVFEKIERASALTTEVRKTCEGLRAKINES